MCKYAYIKYKNQVEHTVGRQTDFAKLTYLLGVVDYCSLHPGVLGKGLCVLIARYSLGVVFIKP